MKMLSKLLLLSCLSVSLNSHSLQTYSCPAQMQCSRNDLASCSFSEWPKDISYLINNNGAVKQGSYNFAAEDGSYEAPNGKNYISCRYIMKEGNISRSIEITLLNYMPIVNDTTQWLISGYFAQCPLNHLSECPFSPVTA